MQNDAITRSMECAGRWRTGRGRWGGRRQATECTCCGRSFSFSPTTAQTGRPAGSAKAQKALSQMRHMQCTCQHHEKKRDVCGVHACFVHTTAMGDRDGQFMRVLSTPPVSRAARRLLIPQVMPLATGSRTTRETAPKAEAPPPAGWGHTRRSRPASKRADDNAVARGTKGTTSNLNLIGVQAREEAATTGPHFSSCDLSFLFYFLLCLATPASSRTSRRSSGR